MVGPLKRLNQHYPDHPFSKVKVLNALVESLTPRKKQNVISNARKSSGPGDRGRPSKIVKNNTDVVSFLQQT